MNESVLAEGKSRICMKCASCCKEYRFITYDEDEALRWLFLDSDKIVVERQQIGNTEIFRIRIKIPCKYLRQDKNGNYYCAIYKEKWRPWACRVYPDNLTLEHMKIEAKDCPILRDFLKKQVSGRGNQK